GAPGGHLLIDYSKTPGLIRDTPAFRQDVVKSRPDDGRKVIRAVGQAVEYWKQNPKDAVEIMTKGLGGWLKEPKDFEEALSGATLYGIAENRTFMGTKAKPGPMYETVQGAIDFWRQNGKLVWPDVKASDVVDPSLLQERRRDGGPGAARGPRSGPLRANRGVASRGRLVLAEGSDPASRLPDRQQHHRRRALRGLGVPRAQRPRPHRVPADAESGGARRGRPDEGWVPLEPHRRLLLRRPHGFRPGLGPRHPSRHPDGHLP